MTDPASRRQPFWELHHASLDGVRRRTRLRAADCKTELLRTLLEIAARKRCSPTVVGWVQAQTPAGPRKLQRKLISFSENADGRSEGYPALLLRGLKTLVDGAKLTMCVDLDDRRDQLLSYNIGIQGITRTSGQRWYARIDLHEEGDEDLRGDSHGGYCNHPLLHCHTGLDPATKEQPEVRCPLPWLMPWHALEWLLATVDPELEPEPRAPAAIDLKDEASVVKWCEHLEISPERLKNVVREVGPLVFHVKQHLKAR